MAAAFVATLVAGTGRRISEASVRAYSDHFKNSDARNVHSTWLVKEQAADIVVEYAEVPASAGQPPPLGGRGHKDKRYHGDLSRVGVFPPATRLPDCGESPHPTLPPRGEGFFGRFVEECSQHSIDCIVQPVENRRKKLLLADMESTIIEQEMLDELADTIGLRDKVAAITARAMNGELDFAAALKERVALLRGLPACVLDDVARRITLMPGAIELLATMKANGASAWLVSGGFTCFAKPVAAKLGFDRVFANELIVRDGMIAGEVGEPIIDRNSKKDLLQQACAESGVSISETLTVGDGANDIPMLSACNQGGGLGVAYHAKPNVRAVVPHRIDHGDLSALLYVQGYGIPSRKLKGSIHITSSSET